MNRPDVTITIEFDPIELTHEEMWPDWDGEAVMTAEDVAGLIKSGGGLTRVVSSWCLISGADVVVSTVRENPHYNDDPVSFGETPTEWLYESTTVRCT